MSQLGKYLRTKVAKLRRLRRGADASDGHVSYRAAIVDLPEPHPPVVTEHRAHVCSFAQCGKRTQAAFPARVAAPVQYGRRICAVVVYLLHGHFLPEDRLAELMHDLFGVNLVPATIARMSRCCADRLQSFVDTVREEVCRAKEAPGRNRLSARQ